MGLASMLTSWVITKMLSFGKTNTHYIMLEIQLILRLIFRSVKEHINPHLMG